MTITTDTQIVPAAAVPMTTPEPSVVRPMPRRKFSHSVHDVNVALPRARRVRFQAGVMLTVGRLLVWIWGFVRFYSGNLLDVLLARASVQRRAVRLRRVLEGGGPTFAKLAQQVSMRADMLPYAYCAELGKMLDQAPAFPLEQAIAIIERTLGQPLADVFEIFDPEPIGSALSYSADVDRAQRLMVLVREGFAASLTEAATRFAVAQPAIGTILVGMATPQQFEDALAAVRKGPLPPEALARLAELQQEFAGEAR